MHHKTLPSPVQPLFPSPVRTNPWSIFQKCSCPPTRRCSRALHTTHAKKQDVGALLSQVKNASKQDEIQAAYRAGAAFLQELGIMQQAEASRILDVAMNPNSLFVPTRSKMRSYNASARRLDVEQDMRPVVACLACHGLSEEQICRVISDHPPVLSYSVEDRIQPIMEYLKELGADPVDVAVRRPSVLGLSVAGSLKRMVGYLKENDYTQEQIIEYISTTL